MIGRYLVSGKSDYRTRKDGFEQCDAVQGARPYRRGFFDVAPSALNELVQLGA
jgi:hypothetical protein